MVNDLSPEVNFRFFRRVDPPHRYVEVCCLASWAVSFSGVD